MRPSTAACQPAPARTAAAARGPPTPRGDTDPARPSTTRRQETPACMALRSPAPRPRAPPRFRRLPSHSRLGQSSLAPFRISGWGNIAAVRPDLPVGTVTFLFTDVEGSTRLLQEVGADAYAAALAEHHRILRQALQAHAGVEVNTQGDAFLAAFTSASEAVAAATDAQRALSAGPIHVRMGLHTGQALLTNGDYVGLELHRGARIAAAAHGGQIVLSRA